MSFIESNNNNFRLSTTKEVQGEVNLQMTYKYISSILGSLNKFCAIIIETIDTQQMGDK